MDLLTAKKLVDSTKRFYDLQSESFSQTRQRPWKGWHGLLKLVGPLCQELDILDLACGNMRFEEFMTNNIVDRIVRSYAFDSCASLANLGNGAFRESFNQLDIISELEKGTLLKTIDRSCPKCFMSVSFGFMHHVPMSNWRADLLRTLVEMTKPMGYICVSFWQIGKSDKLMSKARKITPEGCKALGIDLSSAQGDYLLDWKEDDRAYRYVHDYSDREISQLVASACEAGANLYETYCADGASDDLNRYVILKRDIN